MWPWPPLAGAGSSSSGFSTTVASVVKGVGLGLHLASKMAALVGGRLTLDRDREKGAAFVLSLPSMVDEELAAG